MLNRDIVQDIIYEATSSGGDFVEVFVENNFTTEISTVGGNIEKGMAGREHGVGIRILSGLDSFYAYTNDASRENLISITKRITQGIKGKNKNALINPRAITSPKKHPYIILPSKTEFAKKIEITKRAMEAAMTYDKVISQVTVNYLDQVQNILIANSEGVYVEDIRVRTRLMIIVAAEKNGQIETGFVGPGALMGSEFYDKINIEEFAREAARNAKTMVLADYCPAGNMPVVVDNGFGGLMFHEACGHSLEASSVAKGNSVFSNKLGKQIASEVVTLVDDGSITNAWGSLGIDDEGTATQKNLLIEKGILKGYLIDKLNAKRMNMKATGSGRRQSYRFEPTSRMTNTYIDNGDSTKEEIISNTEQGLFAKGISAGSVNPATGDFNFSLSEAYLIENGKITRPVKGATLIGNGSTILHDVDMVANNLSIGQGYCYASSGALFIGAGQPTIRVKSMTVGGREE
ncbi:TldD/PmbA family protein [Alkaliphilus peptidifermentans]|uniref:TldD protein n=1 Tax=Alkaliphilus peptidifermentans DSM 18978 TaxID=1120976 RepID=A0A1G5AXW7_9FIRM|nr:TldD/PmbA family protein [Alkaliphilus peptidifermentans]SCX82739.1 TldD protein [Alkaliphilus peptidifermentans DSM 18978]